MRKFLVRTTLVLGSLLLLALIASAAVIGFGISVPLDAFRAPVGVALTQALGRPVAVEGKVDLVPTLWPVLDVRGVRVGNPEGEWESADLAYVERLRAQVGLLPLLDGRLHVREALAEGLVLNLERSAIDAVNWDFALGESAPEPDPEVPPPDPPVIQFEALDRLAFTDIRALHLDAVRGYTDEYLLESFELSVPLADKVSGSFRGSLRGKPFAFELDADVYQTLKARQERWEIRATGKTGGADVRFTAVLEPGGEQPEARMSLALSPVDVGNTLQWLNVAKGVDSTAERLQLSMHSRARTASELLLRSSVKASVENGSWTLRDPNSDASLPIHIENGALVIDEGQPVRLLLKGTLDGEPVSIDIGGDKLPAYFGSIARLPMYARIELAGIRLSLDGGVDLPLGQGMLDVKLGLEGERMDRLNGLLDVSLPPYGPFSLAGRFRMTPKGYSIDDLAVQVASSDLAGRLSLETAREPPFLEVDLATEVLQIDDFRAEGWSPTGAAAEEPAAPESASGEPVAAEDQGGTGEAAGALVGPETFRRLDARLGLRVGEVRSGPDRLGAGSVEVRLESGRLSVDPLRVEVPGGNVAVRLVFEPTEKDMYAELAGYVERFDYGILARRVKPESEMDGRISVDFQLSGRTEQMPRFMKTASGYLDVGIWPDDFEAGIFDLWAVGLLQAAFKRVDSKEASRLNCVIGRFDVENGHLTRDLLLLDTSRMRVDGDLDVSFPRETVHALLTPQAKKAQLFSLEVPVEVKGSFDDFGIGVKAVDWVGTSLRFITSPIHVPVRRFAKDQLPSYDPESCEPPPRRAPPPSG